MSIFKTKGIILKIELASSILSKTNFYINEKDNNKIKSGEFLYTIFTNEYGKIKCTKKISKTEKNLDLGYIVNFEITTKETSSIHKIRNIKIISEFNSVNKKFIELNNYLILLSIIHKKTPYGTPIYELFSLLEIINNSENINELKLILLRLKINSIFGELNESHSNKTISKILKFINLNKTEKILKLIGINENLKKELEII